MNEHIEELLSEFKDSEVVLNKIRNFILDFLRTKICEEKKLLLAGIEGRVKSYDSLKGKLLIKSHKYANIKDITDLFGARIVTFYVDEVDIIAAFLDKYFIIDYDNSIDKRKIYEADRFGYMSLHYICKIPKELYSDPKYPDINEFRFEIQIRTCLQHVWATIFHDTGYKTDIEVPKEYIRRLSRLEGLLEIADTEFYNVRNEINQYRNKIRSLVEKGNFKDISLNIDSYTNYLSIDPYRELINRIASITNAEVEEVSYIKFYKVFIDLDLKMLIEVEQMRIDNSEDAYKLSLLQLNGTDIDIISSTLAIQNILIIYIMKKGGSKKEIKNLLEKLYGVGRVTDNFVNKIIDETKGIIMI